MKKQLLQLILCSAFLVFLAITAHAYTAPAGDPSSYNTAGPLDISASNQIKAGGLGVNAFQARGDAYFDQNTYFHGILRGGTPTADTAAIAFGGPSNVVDVAIHGTNSITGIYQSDTLKTGGGQKPVCADKDGTFFICGTTPVDTTKPVPPTPPAAGDITLKVPGVVSCGAHGSCDLPGRSGSVTIPANSTNTYGSDPLPHVFFSLSDAVPQPVTITYKAVQVVHPAAGGVADGFSVNSHYAYAVTANPSVVNEHPIIYPKYIMVNTDIESTHPCFSLSDAATTGSVYKATGNIAVTYTVFMPSTGILHPPTSSTKYITVPAGQSKMCDTTVKADSAIGPGGIFYPTVEVESTSPSTIDNRTIVWNEE